MTVVKLPLTRCMQVSALALVVAGMMLALWTPIEWAWRLPLALAVGGLGTWSWRRHLRRRPQAIVFGRLRGLRCQTADRHEIRIAHCQIGIVNPWLISARLDDDTGDHFDLFVPGASLPAAEHRAVRRALLSFRPSSLRDSRNESAG
ncbi:MAG: hypothetical protein H6953_13800 [Chromatiaceae bacterium]|nr:hypothetical protein [Chromatiaceae bacterium]MCP5312064.1 hypothetical protein [Chromatiaceae bacterium]